MKRLVEQSACVHRQFTVCTFLLDSGEPCPGGTSQEVEVDYDAAYDVLWQHLARLGESEKWMRSWTGAAVDAALKEGS